MVFVFWYNLEIILGTLYIQQWQSAYGVLHWLNYGDPNPCHVKTLIECGACCKMNRKCNAFRFTKEEEKCQIVHLWKATNERPFEDSWIDKMHIDPTGIKSEIFFCWCLIFPSGYFIPMILFSLILSVCNEIQVTESDQFDNADCVSHTCKSEDYSAKWVLEKEKPCDVYHQNIWFAKKGAYNQSITFDLGCHRHFRQIEILNYFDTFGNFVTRQKW